MLRIITHQRDAQVELKRIRSQHPLQWGQPGFATNLSAKIVEIGDIIRKYQIKDPKKMDHLSNLLPINGTQLDAAYQKIPTGLLGAIRQSCQQLEYFYQQKIPKAWVHSPDHEVVFGKRYSPVRRAGFYVESLGSLLTQAIPAKVAKVPQRIMITPLNPQHSHYYAVLVAAQEVGIQEIYPLGGVEAIAILAYGTDQIQPVEVITGGGDAEVSLAKQLVNGTVKIDQPLKNTDLVIIADQSAKSNYIAADLLSYAQQYPASGMILITNEITLAQEVQQRIQEQLQDSPSSILIEKALAHYGLIILVESLEEAVTFTEEIAPDSLILAIAEPWDLIPQIHRVGTIFLGHHTPIAGGDYLGGSSLIYPIAGYGQSGSRISVETFLQSTHLIEYSASALHDVANTLQLLAQAEGFLTKEETIRQRRELE